MRAPARLSRRPILSREVPFNISPMRYFHVVFAVLLLSVQQHAKRRVRMMAGAAISGLVIIGISGYLRLIF